MKNKIQVLLNRTAMYPVFALQKKTAIQW